MRKAVGGKLKDCVDMCHVTRLQHFEYVIWFLVTLRGKVMKEEAVWRYVSPVVTQIRVRDDAYRSRCGGYPSSVELARAQL